ncbi:hypothetical protein MARVELLAND_168 [Bacillus phage vB_BspM_MarvelLand]|nr:hypothetical protein MARVELLAND_168 [Bacillus phage vB_BspM_MarvelLand]
MNITRRDSMWNVFKRKRCRQCGEELKMFTGVAFCDLACCLTYKQIQDEKKERKGKNAANEQRRTD